MFSINEKLIGTATYQANYLKAFNGRRLAHDAPNLSFEQRFRQAGVGCAAENLYAGENRTALQVVMDLLIDQGVQSLGHRKNLLNPDYHTIGIVIKSYSDDGRVVVIDFGCN